MYEFQLRGENGSCFSFATGEPDWRRRPAKREDWISCVVRFECNGFTAVQTPSVLAEEVCLFAQELGAAQNGMTGEITFWTVEDQFQLHLGYERTGAVTVTGYVSALGNMPPRLEFAFLSDQSYVAEALRGLRLMAAALQQALST
jgi:hypothetical protein